MGHKKVVKSGAVKVDSRFEKVFVDPKFAATTRRDAATGQVQRETTLYDVLDHVELDADIRAKAEALKEAEEFVWDAASTSDEELSEDERIAEDVQTLKEQLAREAWSAADGDILRNENSSDRLAVMGLDWSNIDATDIFVLCHTTASTAEELPVENGQMRSSAIKRVCVYLSDFGFEALERERVEGPSFEELELIKKKTEELASQDGELSEATALAVRAYEKKRAMYYYAVVECCSVAVADELYNALDNMDADFAVDGVDLRYIPDSVAEFPRPPTSECEALPKKYTSPAAFQSNNRHTRAELHWDEPDQKRRKILTKRFTDAELNELDLQDYFACSDSEDEQGGVDAERVAAMRKLLLDNAGPVTPAPSVKKIEGDFKIDTTGGSAAQKIEPVEASSDSDDDTAPTRKKSRSGFGLLLGEQNDDEGEDGSESGDEARGGKADLAAELSEEEEKLPKAVLRRARIRAKAKEAKLKRKQKKMAQVVESAVVSEVKADARFTELFDDPKHFVDCTEAKRRRKK